MVQLSSSKMVQYSLEDSFIRIIWYYEEKSENLESATVEEIGETRRS